MKLDFIVDDKKIKSFLITHVPQELETVFPLINSIENNSPIYVIFFREDLYNYYKKNEIFKEIKNKKKIKIIFLKNIIQKFFASIYFFTISNTLFIGDGIKPLYSNFFSKINSILNKKIYIFRHSTSTLLKANQINTPIGKNFIKKHDYLVPTEGCKKRLDLLEFKKVKVIGEVYKDKEYKLLLKKKYHFGKKFILLFSYKSNNSFFKYSDKIMHYKTIIEELKKKKFNYKLIIKPHPDEKILEIKKLMSLFKFTNYKISNKNSLALALNAKFVICLGTSAGLLSYKNDIPTINFYLFSCSKKEERVANSKSVNFLEKIPNAYNVTQLNNFLSSI